MLPTIAPDFAYSNLRIQEGSEAQSAYLEAIAPDPSAARRDELRASLSSFCERDALTMLRLAALEPEPWGLSLAKRTGLSENREPQRASSSTAEN
jgi:hypothetical protein